MADATTLHKALVDKDKKAANEIFSCVVEELGKMQKRVEIMQKTLSALERFFILDNKNGSAENENQP